MWTLIDVKTQQEVKLPWMAVTSSGERVIVTGLSENANRPRIYTSAGDEWFPSVAGLRMVWAEEQTRANPTYHWMPTGEANRYVILSTDPSHPAGANWHMEVRFNGELHTETQQNGMTTLVKLYNDGVLP